MGSKKVIWKVVRVAALTVIGGIFAIALIICCCAYLDARSPKSVRQYLESERLHLTETIKYIPDFRVVKYRHYWQGGDIVDKHIILFKDSLDKKDISTMDSLCRIEGPKGLAGWEHTPLNDGYTFWFFDIARNCTDSITFSPSDNRAYIIFRQTSRWLSIHYKKRMQETEFND